MALGVLSAKREIGTTDASQQGWGTCENPERKLKVKWKKRLYQYTLVHEFAKGGLFVNRYSLPIVVQF